MYFHIGEQMTCEYGQRYFNTEHDACRMCELRDDCPLDPDNFGPDMYYDDEDRDITKRR
jgi:hypothetical protein